MHNSQPGCSPTSTAASPDPKQAELLRKAVVCLEKKLRECTAAVAARDAELERARLDAADLPVVRQRLEEALADREALEHQVQQWQRTAAKARGQAEDARRQQKAAQAAAASARVEQQRQAEQVAQLRADSEALQLEEVRVRGQAEVLTDQVQQLELANGGLRLDNQAHAAKLKTAYEREGQLQAELGEVQAQLRQARNHCNQPGTGQPSAAACPGSGASSAAAGPSGGLEGMHRSLFLAAAAELTRGFNANLEHAEQRAGQLEARLAAITGTVQGLKERQGTLREELLAAQALCSREGEVTAALLDTNLHLHETVVALLEQAQAAPSTSSSEAQHVASPTRDPCRAAQQRQHSRRLAAGQHSSPRSATATAAGQRAAGVSRYGGGCEAVRVTVQLSKQSRGAQDEQQQARMRSGLHAATAAGCPAALSRNSPAEVQQAPESAHKEPRRGPAPKQAAVQAALRLSADHRHLLAAQRQMAAELQQMAGSLVAAPASKQLAVLRQRAQLRHEMMHVAAQLEQTIRELTAMKRTGLI